MVVYIWGMCVHEILEDKKRMKKVMCANSNFQKREILRKYMIAECAKNKVKLTNEEISFFIAKMMEDISESVMAV